MELSTIPRIADIGSSAWNGLLTSADSPFLTYEWLNALEATGAVDRHSGWQPVHFRLNDAEGKLLAVAPAYLKAHSNGEFVFDHAWAEFASQRLGVEYYPKLLLAVPFTPVPGRRLLVRGGEDVGPVTGAFASGIVQLTEKMRLSSAHVLYPTEEEGDGLVMHGLLPRTGRRFTWHNRGYRTFDDFLSELKSKRRAQIRRERREFQSQGFELRTYSGCEVTPERVDFAFEFYVATIERHGIYGRQYLSREFFQQVCSSLKDSVHLVLAYRAGALKPVAGALNFFGGGKLHGRYWGASADGPFLHFNVCYYQGIEDAIERGFSLFDPGVGGDHKLIRGFEPSLDRSVHHLRHPVLSEVVRDHCQRETDAVGRVVREEARVTGYRAPSG